MNISSSRKMKRLKKLCLIFLLSAVSLHGKSGVDIAKLILPSFSKGAVVSKQQFTLKPKELKKVQQSAKAKIHTNIIRFYTVKKGKHIEGYAVLLLQVVRTKKAAVLYVISPQESIKSIEIVAFMEPQEYKPKQSWKNTFKGKRKSDNLFAGKGVPTISGATMTARAIADASRIALAIVHLYK